MDRIMDAVSSNPDGATKSQVKDLADRISALEVLSGEKSKEGALRLQLEEARNALREVRAAHKTESGDLESMKAADERADKLRENLKRKEYQILHLSRTVEKLLSSSSGQSKAGIDDPGSPVIT